MPRFSESSSFRRPRRISARSSWLARSWGAATHAIASVEATGGWADVTLMEQVSLGLAGTLRARAASATLALPLGLEVRRGRVAISPVVVPRLGYGHAVTSTGPLFLGTQGDETRAGGLFMLGGAIAAHIGERTALTVGLEQAFVHGGDPAWGFGLSIDL